MMKLMMKHPPFEYSQAYARCCDEADPLRGLRGEFYLPVHQGAEVLYFTGNSLGLQPKTVRAALETELEDWAALGVEGHFRGTHPWVSYHKRFEQPLAALVGAKPEEVVAMNTLTVNLHLMLASFYQPEGKRTAIVCEAGAFPSDQYALETHLRHRGFQPEEHLLELVPRHGEHTLRTDDIVAVLQNHADRIALVMMAGVQYYTGQAFDIAAITRAAHAIGARVGWDLAHAVGNIPLHLHDWGVDFAVWCSYKYLNSGPGGVAGAFVHERHANNVDIPRLAGWWGNDEHERFKMQRSFRAARGAQAWQLSNAPVLALAAHKAALDVFDKTSMSALRAKSVHLTGFLEYVLRTVMGHRVQIITPSNPDERGCQLSLLVEKQGRQLFEYLTQHGVVVDWREPNVIRIAPVPLYNSFEDVWRLGELLRAYAAMH